MCIKAGTESMKNSFYLKTVKKPSLTSFHPVKHPCTLEPAALYT
jgi:hypothetical protein